MAEGVRASASELRAEQVRMHLVGLPFSLGASAVIALTLALVQRTVADRAALLGWLGCLFIALGARAWVGTAHRRAAARRAVPEWLLRIRLSVALHGLAWGLAGVLLLPAPDVAHQSYLAFAVTLATAGAFALMGFDLVALLLFALPAQLPLVARLFARGDEVGTLTGLMALLFLAFATITALRARRDLRENIALRHREAARSLALQRSDEQLRRAQHIARVGSFDWDPVSEQLHWSDETFRLWGLEPGSVTPSYRVFRQGIHPDDLPALEARLQQALRGGDDYDITHRVRRPDGSVLDIHSRGEVNFDAAGQAVRMVGTVQDITEQRQAEAALAASVENLRLTLNTTGDAIFASDARTPDQPLLFVNDRMLQLWNIPAEKSAHLTPADVIEASRSLFVDPDKEVQRILEIIASGTPQEDRIELRDGQVLLRRCIPTVHAGRHIRVWGFRDITDLTRAEHATVAAKDEAERANRAKSQFLSSMSHELRTPLNAVLGFAQLLESDPEHALPDKQHGYLREVLRGGRHLLTLINDLLDLARIEAGRVALSLEPVDVSEVVGECLRLVAPLALRHGVDIAAAPPSCNCHVVADRTRLKQVLLNLLGNAIKYNRRGGHVAFACHPEDDSVRIEVRDDGPGLDIDQQRKLFQAFERLNADETTVEGAGIGLALSRQLVGLMHGEIGVDSEVGAGSRFWVRLARAEPAQAQALLALAPPVPAEVAQAQPPRTVLYVEDNPVNVVLMEAMFARMPGLRLLSAALPQDGLDLAHAEQPDLILLDIQLQGMDGFEVLRQLRASLATRSIPVIAVSANAMGSDIEHGRQVGFDDYLTKPLDLARLQAAVGKALAARAAVPSA